MLNKIFFPGNQYEFSISFKQRQDEDLSFSLMMQIEELGGWTQHLRLSNPLPIQEKQLRSVESDGN